jgi:hypothetical protein
MIRIDMSYSSKKEGINKARDIIFYFLDLFWSEFFRMNAESEKIVFPSLPKIISLCRFSRRNAYKHIHQMKIDGIFVTGDEGNKAVWPSSFILTINGVTYNPSHFLFENELPEDISDEDINAVIPKLPVNRISELIRMIRVKGESLDNFLSVSLGTERHSYSQEYHYSELPKTAEAFRMWGQKDDEIRKDEERLYKALNPFSDPFDHNTLFDFKEGDSSPFIRLDETKKEYVFAGWCAKVQDNQLIGDFDDEEESNSSIICYNRKKEIISKIPITFPSARNGMPMVAQHAIVGTRIRSQDNPSFLGWYDFKNNIPTERWLMNHAIVSFSKIGFGKDVEFIKIEAGRGSYVSLISMIPYAKFPADIIRKRMENLHSERYMQNNEDIFIFEKAPEITESQYKILCLLNEKLKEASYIPDKNKLLIESYGLLSDFNDSMNKSIEKMMNSNARFSKRFTGLILSVMSASLLIPLSIKNRTPALNEKIRRREKKDYSLLKSIVNHIIMTDHENNDLLGLIITNYRQFRDLRLYFGGDIRFKEFNSMIASTESVIDKNTDINLKLEFYKWRLSVEKNFLENDLLKGGEKAPVERIESIYHKISRTYDELAVFVSESMKKERSEDARAILNNKMMLYRSLSLFFDYSGILFRARYHMNQKKDRDMAEIYKSMEDISKRMF